MSPGTSPRTRDLALRRLAHARRVAIAATVALTIAFTIVAARAFPGHARAGQRTRPAAAPPQRMAPRTEHRAHHRHHHHHHSASTSSSSTSDDSSSSSPSTPQAPAPAQAAPVQPAPAPAPTTQAPVVTSGGS